MFTLGDKMHQLLEKLNWRVNKDAEDTLSSPNYLRATVHCRKASESGICAFWR